MELLILHSDAENSRLGPLWELLQEVRVSYTDCPVRSDTDFDASVLGTGTKHPTHIICVPSKEHPHAWWTYYALGYAEGAGNPRRLCFLFDPLVIGGNGETGPASAAVYGHDRCFPAAAAESMEELRAYLEREIEKQSAATRQEAAKQELFESGLALSTGSFAERVGNGDAKSVRLFLEAGFSPDSVTEKGVPMLNWAVRNEQREVFTLLLSAGADIDGESGDNGNTPIMEAAVNRDEKTIKELLSGGCDIDIQNKNRQTALIIAVANGYTEIAEDLIVHNADISPKDSLGMTARKYAELFHHTQIMTLLDPELAS